MRTQVYDVAHLVVVLFMLPACTLSLVNDKCKYCSLIVETFKTGLKKTENRHFGGGNTAWEEKNLGKFAKSETRLVEVMEYLCKLRNVDPLTKTKFDGVKEIEFKCQQLVEEHEETIENWYFHKQSSDPDMFAWLCHDKLNLCCPEGRYGKDCKPCPGVEKGLPACFGRGKCHGDGSREGKGKCECQKGYVGFMCSNCDANYFAVVQTPNSIECKACHAACTGGCTKEGPAGCVECRSGWIMDADEGCKDINECEDEGRCPGEHASCINTEGSFECSCIADYVRNANGTCVLDVQARPVEVWLPPDVLLRSIALSSLCILLTVVIWRRSVGLLIFAAICLLIVLYIEFRVDHSTVPELSHNIFLS
ncbi:Cysteine-rich with EGF-like domain protein 2 [Toxocara canis]|uniref:Cysteine-rich with EGF-like domain protein 2 n=1 Tax=Toxocara canis TaxID=6265 RepID=A0A0B2UQR9_TOXCA|nr:Cysteine-rich with EGF-like domain protein 2 [Toxocara canis]